METTLKLLKVSRTEKISTDHKDKFEQFLGEILEIPVRNGLTKYLTSLISKYEELLTESLSEEISDNEEPVAKKLPLFIVQGLAYFSMHIPSIETSSEVLQRIKMFAQNTELPNINHVKAVLSMVFTLEIRCKGISQLYKQFAMQLCDLIGIIEDGEKIDNYIQYSILKVGYENTVLAVLCDAVKKMLEHVDWFLLRLKGEHVAMQNSFSDKLQTHREFLKSKEQDVVCEFEKCIIELSKKTKSNLTNCMKMSTYRDFRIKSKLVEAALVQDQGVSDDVEEENEEPEEIEEEDSIGKEPPKKKARRDS
ncbi:hypothetical protein L9F63_026877 [Diploptera punctata]|uniref:FANCI solenoid 4 domain-containing protein n=1 Tax=Diploptera punctata TaxID=6984 RepID=A0AAD8EP61_DIPPU|nr:hypothetical protein L9F63_026877 [Diploptera punctata]